MRYHETIAEVIDALEEDLLHGTTTGWARLADYVDALADRGFLGEKVERMFLEGMKNGFWSQIVKASSQAASKEVDAET